MTGTGSTTGPSGPEHHLVAHGDHDAGGERRQSVATRGHDSQEM